MEARKGRHKPRIDLVALTLAAGTFLAACEDEGNSGDDSLLSGGSLVAVLVVAAVIVGVFILARVGR